jgi:hypothetical protein
VLHFKQTVQPHTAVAVQAAEEPERFSSGRYVESIDLSSSFQATGQELRLQVLLASIDNTETLGMPREANVELLPDPLEGVPELLPLPRIVETSAELEFFQRQVGQTVAAKVAAIIGAMQPLMGAAPVPVEE